MNLFEHIPVAPPDPILGLTDSFRADPNPAKINLSVGVYQNDSGKSTVLESVRTAQKIVFEKMGTKSYLPISGNADYLNRVQDLVFGVNNEMVQTQRVAAVQTPGGTGGLRVAGDFIRHNLGQRTVWVSNPTWANHNGIFEACDLPVKAYPYYDGEKHSLNLDGFLTVLQNIPENDIVLFHGCCHNPTGMDPTAEEWETIAKICKERRLLPLLDFAYQGFAHGLVEDAVAIRAFSQYGLEFFICSSFSKNFGLYQDRTGALLVVAKNADEATSVLSQIKRIIRTNYSNPPALGGAIVSTILSDFNLRQQWEEEVTAMRNRIHTMRSGLVEGLAKAGASADFSFINRQNGMFSFSGLTPEVVKRLREEDSIYLVNSGRINVAGLNSGNLEHFCAAVARKL